MPPKAVFLNDPESIRQLKAGVRVNERLCKRMWRWFKLPTTGTRTRRYTQQQIGADGITRSVQMSEQLTETMSLVIELNTVWKKQANRYPSVDVVFANGEKNLPELTNI